MTGCRRPYRTFIRLILDLAAAETGDNLKESPSSQLTLVDLYGAIGRLQDEASDLTVVFTYVEVRSLRFWHDHTVNTSNMLIICCCRAGWRADECAELAASEHAAQAFLDRHGPNLPEGISNCLAVQEAGGGGE
jgi:hypothetical protein